ncbi:MAG: hypothetical protein HPY53_14930 [Brevinematales bacterium]|nr:hypothetical protein [Brevinematales bacterium]
MKKVVKWIYALSIMLVISLTGAIVSCANNVKDVKNVVSIGDAKVYPLDLTKTIPIDKVKPLTMCGALKDKDMTITEIDSNVITIRIVGTYTCTHPEIVPFIVLVDEGDAAYFDVGIDTKKAEQLKGVSYRDEYQVYFYAPKGCFPVKLTKHKQEYWETDAEENYNNSGFKDVVDLSANDPKYAEVVETFNKCMKLYKNKDMLGIKNMQTSLPGYETDENTAYWADMSDEEISKSVGISIQSLLAAKKAGLNYLYAGLTENLFEKSDVYTISAVKKVKFEGVEHYIVIALFKTDMNGGKFRFWFRYVDGKLMMDNFD